MFGIIVSYLLMVVVGAVLYNIIPSGIPTLYVLGFGGVMVGVVTGMLRLSGWLPFVLWFLVLSAIYPFVGGYIGLYLVYIPLIASLPAAVGNVIGQITRLSGLKVKHL